MTSLPDPNIKYTTFTGPHNICSLTTNTHTQYTLNIPAETLNDYTTGIHIDLAALLTNLLPHNPTEILQTIHQGGMTLAGQTYNAALLTTYETHNYLQLQPPTLIIQLTTPTPPHLKHINVHHNITSLNPRQADLAEDLPDDTTPPVPPWSPTEWAFSDITAFLKEPENPTDIPW